jgi:hypothetical protein
MSHFKIRIMELLMELWKIRDFLIFWPRTSIEILFSSPRTSRNDSRYSAYS